MVKKLTPTAHNAAINGQIAPRVILCGDPKRATFIAKKFLKSYKLVSDVRGICCYTGKYKNIPVSIMAHGMGIDSISIYVYELFAFYGVKTIYRLGSAGSYTNKIQIGDIILATQSWNDSANFTKWLKIKEDKKNIFFPSKTSNDIIISTAKKMKIKLNLQPVCSSNFFYHNLSIQEFMKITNNIKVTEMESFALFAHAKLFKTNAACLLTISDSCLTLTGMSAKERETKFINMIKLGLEAIIKQ